MNPLEVLATWWPSFMRGLSVTVRVSSLACLLGTVLAAPLGWLAYRASNRGLFFRLTTSAVPEMIKAIPILVLLVWLHYLLPGIFKIRIDPFLTTVVVLTLSVAVGGAEVVRSALQSIPHGELEAAYALGLRGYKVALTVGLPLAVRASIPGFALLYIESTKLSTFASVIALGELLHATDLIIGQNYLPIPAYSALAILFVALILPLNWAARRIAAHVQVQR